MSYNKLAGNLKKDKNLQIYIIKNMKLRQLVDGGNSLGFLMGQKLPIVLSFKLSLFVKKIQPELDEFNKKVAELKLEYFEKELTEDGKETGNFKAEDNKLVTKDKENGEKDFMEKYNSLLDQEVDVSIPDISINEFQGIEIEPKHLVQLDWLIKE